MTGRALDPKRLDVAALAADAGTLSGEWPLAGFRRLFEAQPADAPAAAEPAPVKWRAEASLGLLEGAGRHPALQIVADAAVTLQCQRCLQDMTWLLHAERRIFFVEGEDAAAALDAEVEDDVLAYAPAIDLHSLLEDELLLALPIVPRHEVCPDPLLPPDDPAAEDSARENPFAILAGLKTGGLPS